MPKKILAGFFTAVMTAVTFVGQLPGLKAKALLFTPNNTVQSESAILMNMDIGEIVYEKSADLKKMPGSLAQIMTAVLVLENCDNISGEKITAKEDMFTVFEESEYREDLRYADIEAGDTLTVEELLYAMMLTSSCEAAYMLTDHFGKGSQDAFADMMNEKAEALGMTNTRFTNGTALYSARQLSTARDMMTLLSYAMTVPQFEVIACSSAFETQSKSSEEGGDVWEWQHSNLMVDESSDYYCNGVRGIKTSTSQEGGRSIACKGSRDGNNYLLICMGAPNQDMEGNNRFYHLEDAKNVFEWAFAHLTFQELISTNTQLDEVRVNNADGNDYVLLKPEKSFSCIWCDTTDLSSVQQITEWPDEVDAPVMAGDKIGKVTLKLSGETLAEIDVVAASNVERSAWRYNLSEIPGFFRSKYLKSSWVLAIVLSVVYIAACVFFAFRYHEERKKRVAVRAGHMQKKQK
ncbi:MAG: serine hydrolase [Oscillospiraceae bacterium]|nr:serine hydrolase [Oscillospiraceae bacterium]